jgi:hypothetical protein
VEEEIAVLPGEDFLLEVGGLAEQTEGGGEVEEVVEEALGVAEEAVVGAIGLADAEAAESGGFGEALTGSGETAESDVVAAFGESASVVGGIAPGRLVGNEVGFGFLGGTAAERDAEGFLSASEGGVGFWRPGAVDRLIGESDDGAPVHPGNFLARRREYGADYGGIVEVGKRNGLGQTAKLIRTVEHVREKEVVAIEGTAKGVRIDGIPMLLGVVSEKVGQAGGNLEDGIEGNDQVIVFKGDVCNFGDVFGVSLKELNAVWFFAHEVLEVFAFDGDGHDVPIRLQHAGEFPVNGFAGPDIEEFGGGSVAPWDAGPRAEDVEGLLDESDFQRARSCNEV